MFYLITRIKDKKPRSCCRHSNSAIVCLQQGNVIMYLFDEIWVFKKVHCTPYLTHSEENLSQCQAVLVLPIPLFPKMINSLHLLHCAVLSAVRQAQRTSIDVVLAGSRTKTPCSESRTVEQTLSSWINTHKLPSRKAITCVNTDIHCNAP